MGRVDREHAAAFFSARLRYDERFRLELEQARAYGVSHSVFTGRVVEPGEPAFLAEDTDAAIALAMEERDTCPSCGMLKVWCRDPANQFAFEPAEDVCWPTYRLAQHRNGESFKGKHDDTKAATQLAARFRPGHEPDLLAGLDLGEPGDQGDESNQR